VVVIVVVIITSSHLQMPMSSFHLQSVRGQQRRDDHEERRANARRPWQRELTRPFKLGRFRVLVFFIFFVIFGFFDLQLLWFLCCTRPHLFFVFVFVVFVVGFVFFAPPS